MAVVTLWEPDDQTREAYFRCTGTEKCSPGTVTIVPNGPGDLAAAREIGYKPYKIERCPKHYIWASTQALFHHAAFSAAMRYRELPMTDGGVLSQPANFGQLVSHARKEFEWFHSLTAERKRKKT